MMLSFLQRRRSCMVRLEYVIKSVRLKDLKTLLKAKSINDVPEPMMGMLQFSNIAVYDDDDDDKPIHPAVQSMWKKARKDLDQTGRTESVIEIVNFSANDVGQSITIPLYTHKNAQLQGLGAQMMFIPSGDNSQYIEKPMSALSYVETVNATIRSDKENRWLLRQKMGPSDKQLIIDRAAGRRDSFAAIYSKEKLEQQLVYKETETMLQAHASSLESPFILAIMDSTLYAASSEFEDKKLRLCMTLCCSRCTKTGGGFKRCARCKIPIYCSKECQKADWLQHKTRCAKVDTRASARVAQNLFKSEMLHSMLEAIFAIEMDIHNHPDMRRRLFGIQLDYIIEPTNLEDLQTLLNAKSLDDVPGPMMGMFQLTNCLRFGEVVPPPVAHSMWEQARNQLDDLGCYDKPVGILDLTNNAMSVETVLDINEKALDITQGSEHKLVPIPVSDDVNATPIVKPMSVVTFMEAINSIIRNDTDNHLRLRQEMRVSDKQTILDAAKDEQAYRAM